MCTVVLRMNQIRNREDNDSTSGSEGGERVITDDSDGQHAEEEHTDPDEQNASAFPDKLSDEKPPLPPKRALRSNRDALSLPNVMSRPIEYKKRVRD